MPFECANILRRLELAGLVSAYITAQAHRDLIDLPVELWPYESVAHRVWQLRDNVTAYDGTYVALAEVLAIPLVTLDRALERAPGIT